MKFEPNTDTQTNITKAGKTNHTLKPTSLNLRTMREKMPT